MRATRGATGWRARARQRTSFSRSSSSDVAAVPGHAGTWEAEGSPAVIVNAEARDYTLRGHVSFAESTGCVVVAVASEALGARGLLRK